MNCNLLFMISSSSLQGVWMMVRGTIDTTRTVGSMLKSTVRMEKQRQVRSGRWKEQSTIIPINTAVLVEREKKVRIISCEREMFLNFCGGINRLSLEIVFQFMCFQPCEWVKKG